MRIASAVLAALALLAAGCGNGETTAAGVAETEAVGDTTTSTEAPGTTSTTAPTTSTTEEPTTTTEPPLTVSGVAFASQITGDGRAVEPAIEFTPDVNRVYAVFQGDSLPRGLELSVDDPDPTAYYAYLRTSADSNLSTFGWRWFHNGNLVVEYEAEAGASEFFWLERFDRSDAGIFGGDVAVTGMGPGTYTVEFTVSGNALFEESFTVG